MADSTDNSSEKLKDKPFTKKVAYTETNRGKGARALLIIFIIASVVTSIPTIFYILANPFIGNIENANAQQVAFGNGKIFVRTAGASTGYQVYDNVTYSQVGTRTKPGGNEYATLYAKDNLTYGMGSGGSTLYVDYWGGGESTPEGTTLLFESNPKCVVAQGDYAYVGLQNGSIAIVNTTLAPSQSVSLVNVSQSVGNEFGQICIFGNYIYVFAGSSSGSGGPASVVNVSDFTLLGDPQRVFGTIKFGYILGSYAYTFADGNLSIHDLSSPMAPGLVKSHPVGYLGTSVDDFRVCQVGTQRLALIIAGHAILVIDFTDPSNPATLGFISSPGGVGIDNVVEDETRIYVATGSFGIWILAKDKLVGDYLAATMDGMNLLRIMSILLTVMVAMLLITMAIFLWKRERRMAEAKRVEFWIKSSTVTRTGLLFALIFPVVAPLLVFTGMLNFSWLIVIIPAIVGVLLFSLPRIALRRQRKRKQKMTAGTDQRTRLLGMVKAEKKLNVKTASEMTGMSEDRVKTLIYDLVGEGKLEGDFQGDTFVITSDVNDFIKGLEDSFATWEEQAKTGEDKKV